MALKPGAFQACFANWLQSLRAAAATATGVKQPILAVDGKTVRRSHDRKNGLGALHSVSVWASDFGLSLGQVACAEKSNEVEEGHSRVAEAGGHPSAIGDVPPTAIARHLTASCRCRPRR